MSAAIKFKNRYTKGNRFHGFKKRREPIEIVERQSGRNETDPGTRKRGYRFF
tara:strand:+ start:433 stop:588 length:156 start_codon:yes stop_codon:yes gene_type:complete